MNLENHYNELWNRSLQKFRANEFEFDSLLNSENDSRYGITILARPSQQVKRTICDTLNKIRPTAPRQYYYLESDLHLTILSVISCYDGFSLNQINTEKYQEIVQSAVDSIASFEIKFRGLTASPSCILVQGFPSGNQLNVLRNELREKFKDSDLQHSIDKRYTLHTAHMTVIRFRESFKDAERFITNIAELKEAEFGRCVIDEIELVGNDWYHQKEKVESFAKFPLKN